MRIISKFYDYYDSAQAMGQDKSIIYLRKKEEVKNFKNIPHVLLNFLKELPDYNHYMRSDDISIRPFLVFFCGDVYLGYCLSNLKDPSKRYMADSVDDIYVYNLKALEDVIEKYDKDLFKEFLDKKKKPLYKAWRPWPRFNHDNLEEIFKEFANKKIDIGVHLDEKAPILLLYKKNRNHVYIRNPILKDVQFVKKMDVYTTFQKIAMFIGGVVSGTFPPTVEISEKERIKKQGFDKWSFRKKGKNSK